MRVVIVVIFLFLVFQSPFLFGPVIILKFDRFELFMDPVHELLPDLSGPGGSLKSPHALRSIAAYPDCRRIIVSETAEPSVLGVVCSSCLAGAWHIVRQPQAASCAPIFFQNALKDAHHLPCRVLIVDLGGYPVIRIDRISFIVKDPADAGRYPVFPVILQSAIACGHLHWLDAVSKSAQARRERIIGIHDL